MEAVTLVCSIGILNQVKSSCLTIP